MIDKVEKFFKEMIEPERFAQYVRQYNHTAMYKKLEAIDSGEDVMYIKEMLDGVFWTNELADILDPPKE